MQLVVNRHTESIRPSNLFESIRINYYQLYRHRPILLPLLRLTLSWVGFNVPLDTV